MADGAVARSMFLEKSVEAEKWRSVAEILAEQVASLSGDGDIHDETAAWIDWAVVQWRKRLPHG